MRMRVPHLVMALALFASVAGCSKGPQANKARLVLRAQKARLATVRALYRHPRRFPVVKDCESAQLQQDGHASAKLPRLSSHCGRMRRVV